MNFREPTPVMDPKVAGVSTEGTQDTMCEITGIGAQNPHSQSIPESLSEEPLTNESTPGRSINQEDQLPSNGGAQGGCSQVTTTASEATEERAKDNEVALTFASEVSTSQQNKAFSQATIVPTPTAKDPTTTQDTSFILPEGSALQFLESQVEHMHVI